MLCMVRAAGAVRGSRVLPRQAGGAINLIPVRRIVFFKFREPPRDAHLLEHCQIRRGVSVVGIDERAIPVEENSFNGVFGFGKHGSTEEQKRGKAELWRSENSGPMSCRHF